MNTLLLEIGSEEIPAGYIIPALKALLANIEKQLKDQRISHGESKYYGTPKRLTIEIKDVAQMQSALTSEVTGPPEKIAYDADGNLTIPGKKFAEKLGIAESEIVLKETKKGKYLSAVVEEDVSDSKDILVNILPTAILATPFPKTMKWGSQDVFFARPVRSICAILGSDVVPFKIGDITSSNKIYGHRFMSPGQIEVTDVSKYSDLLKDAFVIADIEERKALVKTAINEKAKSIDGNILPDEELVNIVTNLIEQPEVTAGKFDDEFLELPDEVLITTMREHQKYFAVTDDSGKLLSNFIVVNNTTAKDMDLVSSGHEKVIRARLADAQFFYRADLERSFDDWRESLKGVMFQAKLGSMYDKSKRVAILAKFIAEKVKRSAEETENIVRAAEICKADLVTFVVDEFPKLQGVIGRIYAENKSENKEVSTAIEEHYKPVRSGGDLPSTITGSILSIADKIDTICGCFSVGQIPTGASDPYALRRQCIGIIQIIQKTGLKISLKSILGESTKLYNIEGDSKDKIVTNVYSFMQSRIDHLLLDDGFSKDIIAAVTSVSVDMLDEVRSKVEVLQKLTAKDDFEPLAVAFKRVVNIIKKADSPDSFDIDQTIFEHDCETNLYDKFKNISSEVTKALEVSDFETSLSQIASLKDSVDDFFDNAMVMADDMKIRNNRLALLTKISDLFANIADFSKITTK